MATIKHWWKRSKNILRLSVLLAKVGFKLRNEGSYLGVFWYLLSPLALFCVILFIKGAAFSDVNIPYYPLYLLMGITGLNFFRQVLSDSINSISTNVDYIKSINNVAPEVLVVSGVLRSVFSHIFEFVLIAGFMIFLKIPLVGLLFYPLIFFFFSLLVLGIAFIFATIGVYINDLDNIWSIMSQLLFLATPIFYAVPTGGLIYIVNLFNPLFYFLAIARSVVIYSTLPPLWMILTMVVLSPSLFLIGCFVFSRYKRKFAELV